MHMKVRKDIDIGWGMLGLEEAENPKPLQDLVDKAVAVLNTLRRLQLRVTFERLGLNVEDGCSSKNVQTDDSVTELAERYTNSQVFKNACVSEGARQNEEVERQRQVMRNHIASPAPVVGNLGSGGFSRTPQDVAHEIDLTGLALAIIPIRSLTFEPTDGDGTTDDQEFAMTTRTNNIVSEDGLSLLGENACKTIESKDSR
jgi:hypothetical protein